MPDRLGIQHAHRDEMPAFQLASIAPRLARARDDHNALVAEQDRKHRQHLAAIHQAERLVAHRDLQLQRAFHTRNPRYIRERQGKLKAAEHALASLRAADRRRAA